MEARVIDKRKLPSRHVTEGPEHAPHRSYYYAMGLLKDGDIIDIDAETGTLSVRVDEATLAARKKTWKPRQGTYTSGAIWKYAQGVGPARQGAVTHPGGAAETVSYADL